MIDDEVGKELCVLDLSLAKLLLDELHKSGCVMQDVQERLSIYACAAVGHDREAVLQSNITVFNQLA